MLSKIHTLWSHLSKDQQNQILIALLIFVLTSLLASLIYIFRQALFAIGRWLLFKRRSSIKLRLTSIEFIPFSVSTYKDKFEDQYLVIGLEIINQSDKRWLTIKISEARVSESTDWCIKVAQIRRKNHRTFLATSCIPEPFIDPYLGPPAITDYYFGPPIEEPFEFRCDLIIDNQAPPVRKKIGLLVCNLPRTIDLATILITIIEEPPQKPHPIEVSFKKQGNEISLLQKQGFCRKGLF